MSQMPLYLVLGALLAVAGTARLLLTEDLIRRVVGLNIAGGGVLMVIVAVGFDAREPDPVTHALALTGIVITVSVSAFALALARRIEDDDARDEDAARDGEPGEDGGQADGEPVGAEPADGAAPPPAGTGETS
ncbi:MAG TPA: NADH-quinone oxidoreductase subunit K [Actinomycetaceae bacterium]|nr:NADH-quinone oxidoreductase subunit K [Actinomycetaceae bacterium]